jgi:hypothetical protein
MSVTPNDRVAIAAHLHVLLRRRTGRVTDTEWMAINAEYAQAMIRFARERAISDKAPELEEWALRLERAWAAPIEQARQSFVDAAMRTVSLRVNPDTGLAAPAPAPSRPGAPGAPAAPGAPKPGGPPPPPPAGGGRYIGGLR